MQKIDFNEMMALNGALSGAKKGINNVLKEQLDFCFKHLVNRCFHFQDENMEEYFCFLDAFITPDRNALLKCIGVYKGRCVDLSVNAIESTYKSLGCITDIFKEKSFEETPYSSFKDAYTEACTQISEDVRKFHLANPTAPKDEDSQSEEGE